MANKRKVVIPYAEKLKDPRWQKKRLEILERDNWRCQSCYDSETMLVIHHWKYVNNKEPWDYQEDLLTTLCESCHAAEKDRPVYEKELIEALQCKFFAGDIARIAQGFSALELQYDSSVVSNAYLNALSSPTIQEELIYKAFPHIFKREIENGKAT